jgi:diguanylate cyclase (GGDEF)-like protein
MDGHLRTTSQRTRVAFAGVMALAFMAVLLQTSGTNWRLVGVAAAVALLVVAVASTPWFTLGSATMMLTLPLTTDAVIATLRQAQGGSISGYAPLVILPVVWVGVMHGRRAVAAITATTGLMFALPILLIGPPMYPASGWRGVTLWTIVAAVVGTGVHLAVRHHRRLVAQSDSQAERLARLTEIQGTLATFDGDASRLMTVAAESAQLLTDADAACIELLDHYEIVCAAAAGAATEFLGLRLTARDSLTGQCFATKQVLICTDSETDDRVHRDACRLVGARCLILVPLLHANEVKGVLLVWWHAANAITTAGSRLLPLVGNIIGSALARAELIEQLTDQADTDELTGLANRRAWYAQLGHAVDRARRSQNALTVLAIDVDGLKAVNDNVGHHAGDELLQTAARRWTSVLRTTDLLGRLGGDEFGVILEMTDADEATQVVRRLTASLCDEYQASIGVAVWNRIEDVDTLVRRADAQMYKQKRDRNASRLSDAHAVPLRGAG